LSGLLPLTKYVYQSCDNDPNNGTPYTYCGGHDGKSTTFETFTTAASPCPASVSGQCLPLGNLSGWNQILADDFSVNSAVGSWGTSDPSKVVYTGDHGGQWTEYPDGWPSTNTNGAPGYEPSQVLSTHDGVLDFSLHNVNGLPAGANPSPVMPSGIVAGGGSYQTYGMYSVRMKVQYDDAHRLDDFHIAFLLEPQDGAAWASAESDFPEMTLNDGQVCAFAHYGPSTGNGSTQDAYCQNIDMSQWHTFTQEWGPGYRSYSIDGQLIGTSTNQVWSGPERWQLQTEPSRINDGDTGHVLVDWVTVYSMA
jgi:hypothetical protein